jgi:transcriptional regulator with XRE-family HTH domain
MLLNDKIREARRSKRYTLEQLAQMIGLTKGYLSRIERSDKVPPFATVQLIADALGLDITELLGKNADHMDSRNISIFRNTDNLNDEGAENDPIYSFKPLIHEYRNKYMSPFLFKIKIGTSNVMKHDSEEFVFVIDGEIELNYEGKTYLIKKGDSFYLDSRLNHLYTN